MREPAFHSQRKPVVRRSRNPSTSDYADRRLGRGTRTRSAVEPAVLRVGERPVSVGLETDSHVQGEEPLYGRTARGHALLTLAFALATCAGCASQARAAAWLSPVDVSLPQPSSGCGLLSSQPGAASVEVAVDGRGDTIAVWTERDGAAQAVRVAVRLPGRSFGPPQTLGTTLPCYFLGILGAAPKVAAGANGDAVVVWAHPLASTTVIQASLRTGGDAFGDAVDLSDASRTAGSDPDVAIGADGTAMAVWRWDDGAHTVIQAATRAPGGAFPAAGGATTLSSGGQNADFARVAMNDGGDAAVVWTRSNGANEIAQARVRPAGAEFTSTVNLSPSAADASSPDVAIDPAGRATAVWLRADHVESRFLTAGGALDGGVDDVSDIAETVSFPSVALDAGNTAVVVWTGGSLTKAAWRASRASFGSPQTISPPGDSNALPRVVTNATGDAIAIWSQGLVTVQAATRPAGGSFGGVVDISRPPGSAVVPSAATDSVGHVVVGWAFARPAPDGRLVAQVTAYDAVAPRLTGVQVPAIATAGAAAGMTAAASDDWSGAAIGWGFGDGSTASGASVSHAYGAAGVYTVTVTATDGAGNAVSTQRTIQVAAPPLTLLASPSRSAAPARPARIDVTVAFRYKADRRATRLTRFTIKRVPRGATVLVTCKPPRRPHHKRPRCPARTFRAKPRHSSVKVSTFLRKRLVRRTLIEARVTQRGKIGAVKQLRIRTRNGPSVATRCLPSGSERIVRC